MSKKVYVKPYPKEFLEQVVKLVQLGDRSALEVAREWFHRRQITSHPRRIHVSLC